jgi:hypothetical protein
MQGPQRVQEIDQKIKLIVFLKMMKKFLTIRPDRMNGSSHAKTFGSLLSPLSFKQFQA